MRPSFRKLARPRRADADAKALEWLIVMAVLVAVLIGGLHFLTRSMNSGGPVPGTGHDPRGDARQPVLRGPP